MVFAPIVKESSIPIAKVNEPFLIQHGFIIRTPRGREVTAKAYEHLNLKPNKTQKDLFD